MATLVGDNTVLWGADGLYGTGQIIRDMSVRTTGEKLEIQNSEGDTVTVIYFDEKQECSVMIVVKTSAPTLARGDFITIGGVADAIVDETELMAENRNVRTFRITATKYENISDGA